ncbi:MAG: hypothetical protein JRI34_12625 [Deltaproteobacteria bacterium]|nr:hypothetical protein [Deltaproteobacteria bacterium]
MAKKVKEKFGEAINIKMYTTDSLEAEQYGIRSAITVFINGEQVPVKTAMSQEKMEEYLRELL